MTEKEQEKSVHSMLGGADTNLENNLIKYGEIDLGFCKIIRKEIKGGRGKSHGTPFKIGKFYKLGVQMSHKFKQRINQK